MNKSIEEICQLWRYQNSECKFTDLLRNKIEGYGNGKQYSMSEARKQRQYWLQQNKFQKFGPQDLLIKTKEHLLDKALHPQEDFFNGKIHYQIKKQPYGRNRPCLRMYSDAAKDNLEPVVVDCSLYSQEHGDQEEQKRMKIVSYLETIISKFGQSLKEDENWQLQLILIFQAIENSKDQNNSQLYNQLIQLLPPLDSQQSTKQQIVSYLINYRHEIEEFLEESQLLEDELIDEMKEKLKKPKKPAPPKKELENINLNKMPPIKPINFLDLKQNQLAEVTPSVKKYDYPEFIEFRVAPTISLTEQSHTRIRISDFIFDKYSRCFPNLFLNMIDSTVFEAAFNHPGNMFICAPKGIDFINITVISILQTIKSLKKAQNIKVVYITPMKMTAKKLVSTLATKFPQLTVHQSTGDVQLTQRQFNSTNILVTNPQKWDITTRKSASVLGSANLVIIEDMHLLMDERGWVLESVIARMLVANDKSQSKIRIVGLSANVSNYGEIGEFLRVDRQKCLFNFGNQYRAVPLALSFIGIKNSKNEENNIIRRRQSIEIYNQKCYHTARNFLQSHKQVIIFVHTIKQIHQFCEYILKKSKISGDDYLLKSVSATSRYNISNNYLKRVCNDCIGFHHPGLKKSDRAIVEQLFVKGDLKILVVTKIFAWSMDISAYAVIIKGTEIYDPSQSDKMNLSALDLHQIFSRAGRPQFDTTSQAIIISDFSQANHYMQILTNICQVNSALQNHLYESLNAQIITGNINNEMQALKWLKNTFMAVRIQNNPSLVCKRGQSYEAFLKDKVKEVLEKLDKMKIVRTLRVDGKDKKNEKIMLVTSTQLGRITSHYYIRCETMEHLCHSLQIYSADQREKQKQFYYKDDKQILSILSECKEFQSLKPRPEQLQELKQLKKYWFLDENSLNKSKKKPTNIFQKPAMQASQKVLLLIQGYLRYINYQSISLKNDGEYVIQNSIRLFRCMLDLCSKKNQAENVRIILNWCKYLENRMYKDDSPLKQFTYYSYVGYHAMKVRKEETGDFLKELYYEMFLNSGVSVSKFLAMDFPRKVQLLQPDGSTSILIKTIQKFCQYLPAVTVKYIARPITDTTLKIDIFLTPNWKFHPKWHNKAQLFWVLLDNQKQLVYCETIAIEEEFVRTRQTIKCSFSINYKANLENNYRLLVVSDRWVTEDEQIEVNCEVLGIDTEHTQFTEMLQLQPLSVSINQKAKQIFPFEFFNSLQTQLFFKLSHENDNLLIGAPSGSGKTTLSELAILNLFSAQPQKKCVYIAPKQTLVKEKLKDWGDRFRKIQKSVVGVDGRSMMKIFQKLEKCDVVVVAAEKWESLTRGNKSNMRQFMSKVGLMIFDELHILGEQEGQNMEIIISRLNKQKKQQPELQIRMIGLSSPIANGSDMANWFGCTKKNFINFDNPFSKHKKFYQLRFEGFSQKNYISRMANMNKPIFSQIRKHPNRSQVIIFVSSKRQILLTANDLILLSKLEKKDEGLFMLGDPEEIRRAAERTHDEYLKQTLSCGIALWHAGLDSHDKQLCEKLYKSRSVRVMIVVSLSVWEVNLYAGLVIIKGTQQYDCKSHKYSDMSTPDLLKMIGRAGGPHYSSNENERGRAIILIESSKKSFYQKFLKSPHPIQSNLAKNLQNYINSQIAAQGIQNQEQFVGWMTWTFLFRRILKNPNYYQIPSNNVDDICTFLRGVSSKVFDNLAKLQCIYKAGKDYVPTELGYIAAEYCIKCQTLYRFKMQVQQDLKFESLLKILSEAEQFQSIPFRYNQQNHNKQLSSIAPYKLKNYGTISQKIFLLLQMHIYRLPFPIRQYADDCKLAIEISNRVVLGLIEISIGKRIFDAAKKAIEIQQALCQGFSCVIPYVGEKVWSELCGRYDGLRGLVKICGMGDLSDKYKQLTKFLRSVIPNLDKQTESLIFKTIRSFPQMALSTQLTKHKKNSTLILTLSIKNANPQNWLLQSKNNSTMWLLLKGDNNQLIDAKRIAIRKNMEIEINEIPLEQKNLSLYLMPDCFVGIDHVSEVADQ